MRLEAAGLGPLHVLADLLDLAGVHRIARQGPLLQKLAQVLAVESVVDDLMQPGPDLGLVAVADRLR